jgi:hypothetical protein
MGGGEPPGPRVDRFYRVTFADERGFRRWTEHVVELSAVVRDIVIEHLELRPVIFVPLRPTESGTLRAYVSSGARTLLAHVSGWAEVDPLPVTASALPPGLTMLFGDGIDAAEYERLHA